MSNNHWILKTIEPLEREPFYGTVTLRFRKGVCYQIDELRTRKPPTEEAGERPEETTE